MKKRYYLLIEHWIKVILKANDNIIKRRDAELGLFFTKLATTILNAEVQRCRVRFVLHKASDNNIERRDAELD